VKKIRTRSSTKWKSLIKSKAKFVLYNKQDNIVYKWNIELKMSYKYTSNLCMCLNLD